MRRGFDIQTHAAHMDCMDWTLSAILPILTLGALGAVLPVVVARRFPDTLAGLAWAMVLSAGLMVLAGTSLWVLLYRDAGLPLTELAEDPVGAIRHFAGLGFKAGLIWGPIMALVGLGLAQGIEARRGRRMAARDPDK